MLIKTIPCQHSNKKGSALVYILVAIALIGTLTVTMLNGASQSARSQKAFQLAAALEGQIKLYESTIQECIINYPSGDSSINGSGITDAGYIAPYPLAPNSTHFTGSTLGPAASNTASDVRCPGDPGIDNNHSPLFGPTIGHFAPPPPSKLSNWLYYNLAGTVTGDNVDGVYLQTSSTTSDAYIQDAMQKIASKYSNCKIDYIVGNGSNGCQNGGYCLRYWLVRNSAC